MPIYEYECPSHGRYEVSQRITEDALKVCGEPGCGQPVRKLISATSFALKGGGWYSDGYGTSKKSDAKSETKPEAKPESKPDAKPDSKSDAKSTAGGCGSPACGTGCAAKAVA